MSSYYVFVYYDTGNYILISVFDLSNIVHSLTDV